MEAEMNFSGFVKARQEKRNPLTLQFLSRLRPTVDMALIQILSHLIYKDINQAIIYAPGSSHAYIQQNHQDITTHITK
jgi:hypothetical protein